MCSTAVVTQECSAHPVEVLQSPFKHLTRSRTLVYCQKDVASLAVHLSGQSEVSEIVAVEVSGYRNDVMLASK